MDFLGSIISDNKAILTLTIPELHFVYIRLIESPDSNKIITLFNQLEDKLGKNDFKKLFSCILTDRDPCFSNFTGIEYSHIDGEERTRMFYCDPYCSSQKANVENMNKQLRKFFPKGTSIDKYKDEDIKQFNSILIDQKIKSLGGYSPKEAFVKVFGKEIIEKLFNY